MESHSRQVEAAPAAGAGAGKMGAPNAAVAFVASSMWFKLGAVLGALAVLMGTGARGALKIHRYYLVLMCFAVCAWLLWLHRGVWRAQAEVHDRRR